MLLVHGWGGHSGQMTALVEPAELAGRWPGAQLRRTEGLGHLRLLRGERCVAEAVRFRQG